MLITAPIPNLIGGMSQQPPSIRDNNEAADILNAVPSPTEGLIKRPPTELIVRLAGTTDTLFASATNPPFMHMIERDETERYIMNITAGGNLSIYDLLGNEKTVYTSTGSTLGLVTDPSQRRALTVGDVTFILNTNTFARTTASVSPQSPANYNRSGLIWIRQANYNRAHTVKIIQGANVYTFTHITRAVEVTNTGGSGTDGTYSNVLLTYVSGTKAFTYPKATISVNAGKVTSVRITQDATDWESEDIDTELSTVVAGIPSNFRLTIKSLFTGEVGTEKTALALTTGSTSSYIGPIGGIKALSGFSTTVATDGVIRLSSSADFTVEVEDDFAGEGISFIRDAVQRFEDLPPTAPPNYTVRVQGVPETRTDDYYVTFIASSSNRGLWTETVAPGIKDEIDPATMPKILVRQADGTFMLKQADGVVPSSGVPVGMIGVYEALKWDKRLVGDNDTNPMPSFIDATIQDMVYYQNRLGFASGENLILSETGESFNFFRTTVIDLLDSDPIDVASSAPKVSKIVGIVPFNRDLILFSPSNQMIMRGPAVLTPTTVSIASVGDYDSLSSKVKPIPSANSIFFPYKNGNFCGIREMVPNEMLDGSYVASELTGNVPRLIPSNIRSMATTTHENLVAVVADNDLYCYRYFNGPQGRLQSAWFRFQFPDCNGTGNAIPIWCHFVESDLYIGMLHFREAVGATYYITIEKMKMGAKATDADITGSEWATHLDLRSYLLAGAGTYDATTNTTTFNLPHPLNYQQDKTVAILPNGYILKTVSGTSYTGTDKTQTGTLTVLGDYSAENVFVGLLYPMEFEMSQFYLKGPAGQGEAALLNGRCQIKHLVLQYAETGYFRVEVEIENGSTYSYVFTGETVGLAVTGAPNILTGSIRIPVASRNTQAKIRIKNDSPLPSKILSGEYEVMYSDRAVRYTR